MAGLNYGNKYTRQPDWRFKGGVFHATKINKFIVRVKRDGRFTTISQHMTEAEAREAYELNK